MAISSIKKAAAILKNGGVVIFPTDTVYGLGCRFDNRNALDRIYRIKGTPKTQPFPILVSAASQVEKLANLNDVAQKLIEKYWPSALTIVLPGLSTSSKPGLNAEKIGFRMPDSSLVQSLIEKVGVPLIGTSANFHGHPASKTYQDLDPDFVKLADFTIKGKCTFGIESTVIDATSDPSRILRKGAISLR